MEQKYLDRLPESIKLEGSFIKKEVNIDGKKLNIKPSQAVWCHSDEFNWGYGGSGPAQFALALLLKYLPKEIASKYHQKLKFKFIAGLPSTDFIKTVNLRELMQEVPPLYCQMVGRASR